MNPYATAAAFKQAVETRLRSSSSSGTDFGRRRQLLVFDRFLARITRELGDSVILKGGLVVELRVERARTTKDIDLRLVGSPAGLLERLRRAAELELGDFMVFTIAPDAEHPAIKNEGTRAMNCANCAVATDAAISGSPASALPGVKTSAADLSAHYGARWSPACTANDIESALKTAGDGTRGIVFGEVPNRSYGHFFNVVNDGGVVRYLDGQPGAMTSPAGYSRLWLLPTN